MDAFKQSTIQAAERDEQQVIEEAVAEVAAVTGENVQLRRAFHVGVGKHLDMSPLQVTTGSPHKRGQLCALSPHCCCIVSLTSWHE